MSDGKIDVIHKEIELIQNCISRMSQNSFLIKGWTISIIAISLAIQKDTQNSLYLSLILMIPIFSFWYLDAHFLQLEKMYRTMYQSVIERRAKDDFSFLYELNPRRFRQNVNSIGKLMFSGTLLIFYGTLFLVSMSILMYGLLA